MRVYQFRHSRSGTALYRASPAPVGPISLVRIGPPRRYRLGVRTPDSQSGNRGSNPRSGISLSASASIFRLGSSSDRLQQAAGDEGMRSGTDDKGPEETAMKAREGSVSRGRECGPAGRGLLQAEAKPVSGEAVLACQGQLGCRCKGDDAKTRDRRSLGQGAIRFPPFRTAEGSGCELRSPRAERADQNPHQGVPGRLRAGLDFHRVAVDEGELLKVRGHDREANAR